MYEKILYKPALVPGRIIADVLLQECLYKLKLVLPCVKVLQSPLPMCPSVVILGVNLKDVVRKCELSLAIIKHFCNLSPMVPNLVVLGVISWKLVHEVDLLHQVHTYALIALRRKCHTV